MKYLHTICILLTVICMSSCKKYVEIDPPVTSASSGSVFTRDAEAAAVLTGIYGKMGAGTQNFSQGTRSIGLYAGLSADELQTYSVLGTALFNYYTNSNQIGTGALWQELYQTIYVANSALEGLSTSHGVTDSVKKQLTGEAKFMRAFLHFYLVNLFGDVPLVTTTDYRLNATVKRTPKADVYQQIIKDLLDAQQLLPDYYAGPVGGSTTERVRPNKAVASALLARTYLYTGDWIKAEEQASSVINNTWYALTPLTGAFLKNNSEAIWQVQTTSPSYNTLDGSMYIRSAAPNGVEPASLRPAFLSAFEPGDQRRLKWVDSATFNSIKYYQPAKYRVKGGGASTPVTEYPTIMRLAEVYLIRAEARAQQTKISESRADLLTIRKRAGLADSTLVANDKNALLAAVAHERQVELFSEWGHRWFDLKRTGTIDGVMSVVTPLKGGTWNSNMQWYKIPDSEISLNPNLTQNPGY